MDDLPRRLAFMVLEYIMQGPKEVGRPTAMMPMNHVNDQLCMQILQIVVVLHIPWQ